VTKQRLRAACNVHPRTGSDAATRAVRKVTGAVAQRS